MSLDPGRHRPAVRVQLPIRRCPEGWPWMVHHFVIPSMLRFSGSSLFLRLSMCGWLVAAGGQVPVVAGATDHPPEAFSGGDLTVFNDGKDAYSIAAPNLSRENRRMFVVGNSFFNENWIIAPASAAGRDGLGPLFHARSCSSCHVKDGRGAPPLEGETMTGLLLRLSVPGGEPEGMPQPDPVYGHQLAVRALPGHLPEATVDVKWETSKRTLPHGTEVSLRRPVFQMRDWSDGPPAANLRIGPRLAPPVYGLGLLEAVPEASVIALADPQDANGDGISGRINRVFDSRTGTLQLGRFGWKANQPNLRQQTAEAFTGDIGITTSLHPQESLTAAQQPRLGSIVNGGTPELSDHLLDRVERYVQTLAVPARRNVLDPKFQAGEKVFHAAQCAACHVPELRTGPDHPLPELRDQTFRPFTDLLLHDMGAGLADDRPDFAASGSEWRTPPLWGLGLNQAVNGNVFFLHDGRARTLTEAILWHDGEAAASRIHFEEMSAGDRENLILFLESL